jgi:chromosome segregation ATPase
MSGVTGMGGATETLLNMIELFADPKAAKARVLELQEATKKAQASIDDASQREHNAHVAEQRAQAQRADLSAAIGVHNQSVARFEATRDQTNVALAQRENAVKELEKKFEETSKSVRAEFAQKSKDLTDRETAVARRERDAEARAAELQRREDRLTRRDRAIEQAIAAP